MPPGGISPPRARARGPPRACRAAAATRFPSCLRLADQRVGAGSGATSTDCFSLIAGSDFSDSDSPQFRVQENRSRPRPTADIGPSDCGSGTVIDCGRYGYNATWSNDADRCNQFSPTSTIRPELRPSPQCGDCRSGTARPSPSRTRMPSARRSSSTWSTSRSNVSTCRRAALRAVPIPCCACHPKR
jgi:hypothetical protein